MSHSGCTNADQSHRGRTGLWGSEGNDPDEWSTVVEPAGEVTSQTLQSRAAPGTHAKAGRGSGQGRHRTNPGTAQQGDNDTNQRARDQPDHKPDARSIVLIVHVVLLWIHRGLYPG